MASNADLLREVKSHIQAGRYKSALTRLEALLRLLKMDYQTGLNREKSGRAYNALLKVRKELIAGQLTDVSYSILKIPNPHAGQVKPQPAPAPAPAPEPKPQPKPEPKPQPKPEPVDEGKTPEDSVLEGGSFAYQFRWDDIPSITFDDIAGLDECKALVKRKVLLPLLHPEATQGYTTNGGGGVCLYGPPGTGKTMISAAIAHEIKAKFCSITPSDLLQQGLGQTEKAVKQLFREARSFKCAVIYFDEMDAIAPKNTKSTAARQLRSEFLAQLQGIAAYGPQKENILFLICATNKPWDIDSAFLRPGRFGTLVYVGLPDKPARQYMISHHIEKIQQGGIVEIRGYIDVNDIVEKTNGFNCADISNLLRNVEDVSIERAYNSGEKYICQADFNTVLGKIHSTVQAADIERLKAWREENDSPNGPSNSPSVPPEEPEAPEEPPLPSVDEPEDVPPEPVAEDIPEPEPEPIPEPTPEPEPEPEAKAPVEEIVEEEGFALDDLPPFDSPDF